jgi:sugar-specific transcriptional regulator TrmB
MDSGELVEVLREAGLSPYQADAYVTLLGLGSASARELADASGVPGPRIYDVLRDLEDDGLVTTFDRDRLYARANDPESGLAGLRERARRLDAAIEEVTERYRAPERESGEVSVVRQFRTVLERARGNVDDAARHVQVGTTVEQFRALRPALADAHDRGVYVQASLYAPGADGDDDGDAGESEGEEGADGAGRGGDAGSGAFPEPSAFEGVCTEVRRRELRGPFLVLTDRRTACYSPHVHTPREYGVLVDDRVTTYVFHWFFLTSLWEPYGSVYDARPDEPPFGFVEVTECVRFLDPLVHAGATVRVRVEGYSVRTGRERTVAGRVVDVDYTGHEATDDHPAPTLAQLAARAGFVLDPDDGGDRVTVGGEGAVVEDVSADRVVVLAVEDAGGGGDAGGGDGTNGDAGGGDGTNGDAGGGDDDPDAGDGSDAR